MRGITETGQSDIFILRKRRSIPNFTLLRPQFLSFLHWLTIDCTVYDV